MMKKITTAVVSTAMLALVSTSAFAQGTLVRNGATMDYLSSTTLRVGDEIRNDGADNMRINYCNCTIDLAPGEAALLTGDESCANAFRIGKIVNGVKTVGGYGAMGGGGAAGAGLPGAVLAGAAGLAALGVVVTLSDDDDGKTSS